MLVVDSCGWLEWFTDGQLAESYRPFLSEPERLLVPAIVFYEVYKFLKREAGEEKALMAAACMKSSTIVPADDVLCFHAADISLKYGLAMADAFVAATAKLHRAELITSDKDLRDFPGVRFIPKSVSSS